MNASMYPAVKEVIPGDDYILTVVFDNGEDGILDMKTMLDFGVFQRIKDSESFKRLPVVGLQGSQAALSSDVPFPRLTITSVSGCIDGSLTGWN